MEMEGEKPPVEVTTKGTNGLFEKHLQGKKQEWDAITAHKQPLRLLDLPLDILQTILKELTHTNDLTSLALTHSALHDLVIPHIYARFDIVWPDANATLENRMGVDALTYGLATLVMAQDVFGEASYQQQQSHQCQQCGYHNSTDPPPRPKTIRRGNHFAQFTRKFSLGNGPADWVQEYLITKEGGKMLGTLVALAVGRMQSLEAFVWDMPTGVLRDVWMALASLGIRNDGRACRLERVWVRWHNNSEQSPLASPHPSGTLPMPHANLPSILADSATSLFQIPPYPRVEFPTFSILPPLKSLSVLDIDELPYAEEMSVLIERSLDKIQELRVGMAFHARLDIWALPAEEQGPILQPIIPTMSDVPPRPGGILGILVHRFCDAFSHHKQVQAVSVLQPQGDPSEVDAALEAAPDLEREEETEQAVPVSEINQLGVLLSAHNIQDDDSLMVSSSAAKQRPRNGWSQSPKQEHSRHNGDVFQYPVNGPRSARKLQLETLELERVYLSIAVLSKAIDWSRLTTLTLLGCRNHEQLWRALRKRFTPTSRRRASSMPFAATSNGISSIVLRPQASTPKSPTLVADDYPLKLRRLHTDMVSSSLVAFIKDTLAPDSLEWLFLQENTGYKAPVTIDMIYKGCIRRHRSSLTKLLIDSTLRPSDPERQPNTNWRRWVCNRDLITCITSGKMKLRELSMSIDYKDWHYFLRRLPVATTLRSLHIAHIAEHVNGTVHSKEAALQVLDIVALRPELELCYLGVQSQCFEILEYAHIRKGSSTSVGGDLTTDDHGPDMDAMLQSNHSTAVLDHHDHDSPDEGPDDSADTPDDSDFEAISDDPDGNTDDDDGPDRAGGAKANGQSPTWRLREILFYDDKISIFKARHGRL